MEVTLELVEQLRQHADVSYEEARAALEHSGGDLLEALIWLERMGKIGGGDARVGEYHTGPDAPDPRQPGPEAGGAQAQPQAGRDQPERWWSRIWQVLTENRLECSRGDTRFEVPLAVLIAMVLFAFTTLIGNLYYVDNALAYLLGHVPSKRFMVVFRLIAMGLIFLGAGLTLDLVWNLSDVLMGVMVLINIPVIAVLSRPAAAALRNYTEQRRAGKNPVFRAADIDLKEKTEYWN